MIDDFGTTIDEHYQALLAIIIEHGKEKEDRTGTGTKSIFGYTIRHDMTQGFPLLTTKKMAYKSMITELKWFLKGDTNIKYLVDNGCNIWNGDAYKKYKSFNGNYFTERTFIDKIKTNDEFAQQWGELGNVYGAQWRNWGGKYETNSILETTKSTKPGIDQIDNLISQLKTNPDSRRLMVNAWNVGELSDMTLPPCHYGFQVYTTELTHEERYDIWFRNNYETGMEPHHEIIPDFDDEYYTPTPKRKLSLLWNQRSADVFLGLPFNIASYALLLKLIAAEVNMIPDQLIGNLGDAHLYLNHIEQAKEQISRDPMMLPELFVSNVNILNGEFDYDLSDYISHPMIKAPLSN